MDIWGKIMKSQNFFKPEKIFLVIYQFWVTSLYFYISDPRSSFQTYSLLAFLSFWMASTSFPKWTWKAFWSDSASLAFCLSVILVDLLVSLENEERKVKTKSRRKMKDMKFYERNGCIPEHNVTENQVLC